LSAGKSEDREKGGRHVEEQQSFFDGDDTFPDPPAPVPEKSLDERFEEFLVQCPDVYEHFVRLAHQLRNAGHQRYGSKGIVEVIRFHRATMGQDQDGWKINNSFTSRLSRKLIEDDPTFATFFEFRRLRSVLVSVQQDVDRST
jgi:hypothetical protein